MPSLEHNPASKRRQNFSLRFLLILFVLTPLAIAIIYFIWLRLATLGFHYEWQWNRLWRHVGHFGPHGFVAGPLCKGIILTIQITLLGILLSGPIGLAVALMRLSPWPVWNYGAKFYVLLWRGTPLLLQLFFAYFLISPLLSLSPFWTAVIALATFEGAYLAEIFRAGLLSVPVEQWEASLSLGLNLRQTFISVILPQAWRITLPSATNQAIAVLKDSSLVSAIAVADLTMQSQAIIAETFLAFEVWLFAGAVYLCLAFFIALPGLWLESRRRWRLNSYSGG